MQRTYLPTFQLGIRGLVAALWGILVVPQSILAEAAEHGSGHHPSIVDTFPYWVNFLLYCALLYFVLRKNLPNLWRQRASTIESQVRRGEQELARANAELKSAQERMGRIEQDTKAVVAQIAAEARNESAQVMKEAQEHAQRLQAQARDLAAAERRATEKSIKEELARTVVERATARVVRELTPERDRALRDASVQGLQALLNG